MLNKVMLIGNVGQKPEVRYLEGQQPVKVATFSLATTERYRDRNNEMRENTEWHNIVAWRGLADLAEKYIDKGSQLYIEGKIRTRSWTDQSGNKRYTTEIVADTVQLLGRKSDNPANRAPQQGYAQQPQQGYTQPQYQAPAQPQGYAPQQYQQPQYQAPAQQYPQTPVQQQGYAPAQEPIQDGPTDDLPF